MDKPPSFNQGLTSIDTHQQAHLGNRFYDDLVLKLMRVNFQHIGSFQRFKGSGESGRKGPRQEPCLSVLNTEPQ